VLRSEVAYGAVFYVLTIAFISCIYTSHSPCINNRRVFRGGVKLGESFYIIKLDILILTPSWKIIPGLLDETGKLELGSTGSHWSWRNYSGVGWSRRKTDRAQRHNWNETETKLIQKDLKQYWNWFVSLSQNKTTDREPYCCCQCRTSMASNVFDSLWDFSTTCRRRRDLLFQFA